MQYKDGQYLFPIDFKNIENAVNRKGVVEGLEVVPVPNTLKIEVSSGKIIGDGVITIGSNTFTISLPLTFPRKDLVVCDFGGNVSIISGEESEALPPGSIGVFTYSPYPPVVGDGTIVLAEIYLTPSLTSIPPEYVYDRRILLKPVYSGYYDLNDFTGSFIEKLQKAMEKIDRGRIVLPIGTFSNISATITGNKFIEGSWLGTEFQNSTLTVTGNSVYLKDFKLNDSKIIVQGSTIACYNLITENCNPAIECTTPVKASKISACHFNNQKDILIHGTFGTEHSIQKIMITDNISNSPVFAEISGIDLGLINRNIVSGSLLIGGRYVNISSNVFSQGTGTAIKVFKENDNTIGVIKIFNNLTKYWNGTGIESSVEGSLSLIIEHNILDATVPCSINSSGGNFILIRENAFPSSIGILSGSIVAMDNLIYRYYIEGRGQVTAIEFPRTNIPSNSTVTVNRMIVPPSYLKVIGRFFSSSVSGSSIALVINNSTIDISSSNYFYGEEIYSTILSTTSTIDLLVINPTATSGSISGGYLIMVM